MITLGMTNGLKDSFFCEFRSNIKMFGFYPLRSRVLMCLNHKSTIKSGPKIRNKTIAFCFFDSAVSRACIVYPDAITFRRICLGRLVPHTEAM